MKAKLYLGLIFPALCFSFCAKMNAQSQNPPDWAWVKTLSATHGIYGNAIAIDPNGSGDIYVAGGFVGEADFNPGPEIFNLSTESLFNVGIFVSKFDGSGNFIWAKAMNGEAGGAGFATSIAIDPVDGAIYTTGHADGTVDFDPGPNTFNLTSKSNTCSPSSFCGDIFISKLDSEGNFVWATVMGGPDDDFGSSLVIDPRGCGDVYISGQFKGTVDFLPGPEASNLTSAGDYDIFISRLNSSGNYLWTKAIGGTGSDISRTIAFDPAGSGKVYTTGAFESTIDFDPGADTFNLTAPVGQNNFISKLDRSGDFLWARQMGRVGMEYYGSLALDPAGSGDVYTTASFRDTCDFNPGEETYNLISNTGSSDIFISKLSGSGHFKWANAMGGKSLDIGTAIAIQPGGSGNVYTIGKFRGSVVFDPETDSYDFTSLGYDVFISKLDSAGHFIWAKVIKGTNDDYSHSIAMDEHSLYLTGFSQSSFISFDSLTIPNNNTGGEGADLFIAKIDLIISAVASIDSKTQQLNIYPNPATNELNILIDGDEFFKGDITLYNVLGEVVYSSPVENIGQKKTIDISSLSTGIYFVELYMDGNRVIEKVVKE